MRTLVAPIAVLALAVGCGGDDEPDPGSGDPCGGLLGLACEADEYCDYDEPGCGIADGGGSCRARPNACPEIYAPVMGSDGQVYSNACDAHANGADDCGPPSM
jgi:hypothetical protein